MTGRRRFELPGSAYAYLEALYTIAFTVGGEQRVEVLYDLEDQVPEDVAYRLFAVLMGVLPGGKTDFISERPTMAGIVKLVQRLGGVEI